MKFMKLGTRSDTFYTEQATRTLASDIPTDLVIQVNDITYRLHKFQLLPKCGLLRKLCSDSSDCENGSLELHDIPGGEDAFELCAKFCYGISINISAHNIVPALCAAKFLQMNDNVELGNFVGKLEAFFNSCILEGWKDCIATLQTTLKLSELSENLGIVRKCIDSITEKTLVPPQQVKWSYTYTRPGYNKKQHNSVPKDWWTEDVSDLDLDLFRCIIMAIRSTHVLQPQLIGEALHVYASRWLPSIIKLRNSSSSASQTDQSKEKNQKILETIVSMIPADKGSVSVGFLLKLLVTAYHLGLPTAIKTELTRRASLQLDEATVSDLLYPSRSFSDQHYYDIEIVKTVLESFLKLWKRMTSKSVESSSHSRRSMRNVGKLIDSYLQVVAKDDNLSVSKFVSLAESVPEIARSDHDDLYQAINLYLKKHPGLNKADKKRLCWILECQKLSPEMRSHAVKNELLPLRTVVQVLYCEQEKGLSKAITSCNKLLKPHEVLLAAKHRPPTRDSQGKQSSGPEKQEYKRENGTRRTPVHETKEKDYLKTQRLDSKLPLELERKMAVRGEVEEMQSENKEESISGSKMDLRKLMGRERSKSEHGSEKGRER